MDRDPAAIAVVIFDRAPIFETSVPMSIFGMDRTVSGAPRFDLLAVAGEEGPITTTDRRNRRWRQSAPPMRVGLLTVGFGGRRTPKAQLLQRLR